jgi:hypothetical protein
VLKLIEELGTGGSWKVAEEAISNMIYLIHSENFCKCKCNNDLHPAQQ